MIRWFLLIIREFQSLQRLLPIHLCLFPPAKVWNIIKQRWQGLSHNSFPFKIVVRTPPSPGWLSLLPHSFWGCCPGLGHHFLVYWYFDEAYTLKVSVPESIKLQGLEEACQKHSDGLDFRNPLHSTRSVRPFALGSTAGNSSCHLWTLSVKCANSTTTLATRRQITGSVQLINKLCCTRLHHTAMFC